LKIYHLATLDLILPFFARQLHLTRLLTTSAKTLPLFCRATLTRLWKAINRQIQVRHQPDNPTNGANVMIMSSYFLPEMEILIQITAICAQKTWFS
jgi:hypothetical protein